MLWLVAHNPKINWEKEEVKITKCPPLYGKNKEIKKSKKRKQIVRQRETRKIEEEKAINWAADEKENWGREEEREIDHWKIKEYYKSPL